MPKMTKDVQNYQKILKQFDFSSKNLSIFAHFYPQINSRVYTFIRYPRVVCNVRFNRDCRS